MRTTVLPILWALVALMCGVAAPATADPFAPDSEETKKSKVTYASIKVSGALPETASQIGLFGELEIDLRKLLGRIEKAAEDDAIAGIILEIRNPVIGRGKINEIRAAIAKARKAGKKVYGDIETATASDYLIASACDQIIMPPAGMLMITGVRAEVMFYQKMFEKLGLQADIIQVGDFKGAGEPFTRAEMSPEFRKQYEELVDDLYDQVVTTIAEDRNLKKDKVKSLLDEGLFTPAAASKANLIDLVAYQDEFRKMLMKEDKAGTLAVVRNYGKKEVDTDFSGFTGMIKLMNLMMGIDSSRSMSRSDKIAIVYAVGPIMTGSSQSDLFGSSTVGSDTIVKALRTAAKDSKVKAIVLRVDSPGGSATASDLIWREVVQIKKPLIASMGDVAASGGYYISMGAKRIFVEPGTLTGSIGVVGGKISVGGLFDKIGLTTDVISRGKNSGIFSMTEPFSNSEREVMLRLMTETYAQFTKKAAEGRSMDLDQLEGLAQGRVFTGDQAVENGLADEVGTLDDAIAAAKKLAGLPADKKVELEILPKPKSFIEQMFGGPSIESRAVGTTVGRAAPELAAPLKKYQVLRRLFTEPINTVLPYHVEIR